MTKYPCQILSAPEAYGEVSDAWPFTKGSPLVKIFSHKIRQFRSNGVLARLRTQEGQRTKERNWESCASLDDEVQFKEMGYHNIISLFWLLSAGIFVSLCTLILELLC